MSKKIEWMKEDCSQCMYHTEFSYGSLCRRFPPTKIGVKKYKGFNKDKSYEYKSAYPKVHVDTENAWCWMPACAEYKRSK